MARRAVATEDKKKRKQAILVAARDLFNAGDGTLPAASVIAAAADLAKGTVHIYFRTRKRSSSPFCCRSASTFWTELSWSS